MNKIKISEYHKETRLGNVKQDKKGEFKTRFRELEKTRICLEVTL